MKARKKLVRELAAAAAADDDCVAGFTAIAERVPPKELIKALEEYFNVMTDVIQELEGTVGDFIGDAVFAFWNAPNRVGRPSVKRVAGLVLTPSLTGLHALKAVEAAVAQQKAVRC